MIPKSESNVQVPGSDHYSASYSYGGRIYSYAHQIETALMFAPNSALEIGVGSGFVATGLELLGVKTKTLDIQPENSPDLVGSVTDIPVDKDEFDISICCQVLEHLPFEDFGIALNELRRISKVGLVLSLPDVTRHCHIDFYLPKFGRIHKSFVFPRLKPKKIPLSRLNDLGHYWEIGFNGYPLTLIEESIEKANWVIMDTWRVPELPWHRFFKLK